MNITELKNKIIEAKKETGTVVLAHTYQDPDIIDIADITGDSFFLSKKAAEIKAKRVVMCGVRFMGESVKIDDLARRMIKLSGFKPDKDIMVEYSGLRPGEKLYEEVLSNKENTIPTEHDRIMIAKVRNYDYDNAKEVADELERLSRIVEIPDMVRLMKRTVPEFKSKNSRFEIYDKELEEAANK